MLLKGVMILDKTVMDDLMQICFILSCNVAINYVTFVVRAIKRDM